MFRAALELLIVIVVVMVARSVLTGLMRGVANASQNAFRDDAGAPPQDRPSANAGTKRDAAPSQKSAGELHRDPVCGTYVPESTPYQVRLSGQSFYYCSAACREKHALVKH